MAPTPIGVDDDKPSAALVEEWHARYVAALRALHAAHKDPADPPLVVVGA